MASDQLSERILIALACRATSSASSSTAANLLLHP